MSIESRNTYLLPNICGVNIKSTTAKNLFQDFRKIYGAPSTIKLSAPSKRSKEGYSYLYNLSMFYPGLSETDFEQFFEMLKDKFEIQVKTTDANTWSLSSKYFPFFLSTKYISGKGTTLTFKSQSPIPVKVSYEYGSSGYIINYYE